MELHKKFRKKKFFTRECKSTITAAKLLRIPISHVLVFRLDVKTGFDWLKRRISPRPR